MIRALVVGRERPGRPIPEVVADVAERQLDVLCERLDAPDRLERARGRQRERLLLDVLAVVALATDRNALRHTGQVLVAAALAIDYGFVDIDGKQPQFVKIRCIERTQNRVVTFGVSFTISRHNIDTVQRSKMIG